MRGSAILFLVLTVLLPAAGWLVPGHPLSGLLLPKPLSAQQFTPGDVVLLGRVEDAVSGEPVAGALVMSADSTAAALADSAGEFALPLSPAESYVLLVEQLGYSPTTFELSDSAPSRLSVLALQPTPLALEGVTVVGESQIEDVAMADFYGPQAFGTSTGPRLTPTVGQVRIYTRQWMAMHAGRRRAMMPVEFGC